MAAPPDVDGGTEAGARHQRRLAERGLRRGQGSYYTPVDVVERLLDLTLTPLLVDRSAHGPEAVAALRILDPACGSGNVLVAAASRVADALVTLGLDAAAARAVAFGRCVVGVDLDPEAVRLCRAALRAGSRGAVGPAATTRQVRTADALLLPVEPASGRGTTSWTALQQAVGAGHGFDLVVGNPPFLGQLSTTTAAHRRRHAQALRSRFGAAVARYTDPAALFLLLGVELARPDGGVVGLLEPLSVLASRDAGAVRRAVLADAALVHLWAPGVRLFDAEVQVCAPVLVRASAERATALWRDRTLASAGSAAAPAIGDDSWAELLATIAGLPRRAVRTAGVLADVASATADFRDQYYGLAAHVVDDPAAPETSHPRLITAGLIDPARSAWGQRPTRFNKAVYRWPRVAVEWLDPALRAWARQRSVPKVLVATQTRVLEAVVDVEGTWLPSVPVVTVVPLDGEPATLWRIAALLSSPPATLVAARRHLGAARHGDALKLSARDLLRLPLPVDGDAWDLAATQLAEAAAAAGAAGDDERAHQLLVSAAGSMVAAYGLGADDDLLAWWVARLPHRR